MFHFFPTPLDGAIIIEPQVFGDERGFFMETYSEAAYENAGITTHFVQDNHSRSKAGVLRGLHFQTTHTQSKLVRVTRGSVYDVALDLRKDSLSFGKWYGVLLSSENKKQFFIPRGFAHGFLTLEDDTEFLYKCDDIYSPESESGILYDDASLGIDWGDYYPLADITLSTKDRGLQTLSEFIHHNPF